MGLPAYKLPDYEQEGNAVIHPAFRSVEDYLRLESVSEFKHEYYAHAGEAVPMAGAEPGHNTINYALNQVLGPQRRRRGGQGYLSDQRVETRNATGYLYTDTVVACGPAFSDRARPRSLTNPVLVVEVMSGLTRSRDGARNFSRVARLPASNNTYFSTPSPCGPSYTPATSAGAGCWTKPPTRPPCST